MQMRHDREWSKFTRNTVAIYSLLLLIAVTIIILVAYISPSVHVSESIPTLQTSPVASIAGALKPKILGDINPLQNEKLQRLMHRNFAADADVSSLHKNKLNKALHGRLSPLKSLNKFPRASTKEISFELEVRSLPQNVHRKKHAPTVFIRQVFPEIAAEANNSIDRDVLLIFLHGAAYSSATWSELGILSELAQQGYTSYALDVPGYGQSAQSSATNNKWLREVLTALTTDDARAAKSTAAQLVEKAGGRRTNGKQFVLVTASMSGQYAIPLLFESPPPQMVGMITVAPVHTGKYSKKQYKTVKIPVCIVYGENDAKLGMESKNNLVNVPNHEVIVIPNGEHAAYKTNPKYFHRHIVKWLAEFFD